MSVSLVRFSTRSCLLAAVAMAAVTSPAIDQVAEPTPDTLVSVCSVVSLPRSAVTDLIDPTLTGIYGPI